MPHDEKTRLLEDLLSRLSVERLQEDNFVGRRQTLRKGNVFGGQIIGQALSATYQTVIEDRSVHSLHAYFMRATDANIPLHYAVDRLRDGPSFNTRRVTALQNGKAVFSMLASFQVDEQGPDHQDEMPDVPGPEACSDAVPGIDQMLKNIPRAIRERLLKEKPIEIRYVHRKDSFTQSGRGSAFERLMWFRTVSSLPSLKAVHRAMLAYVSDYSLVATQLYRHGLSFWERGLQAASLDHAMWFHRDFRLDDWLLYAIHSPTACKARGLSLAHVFTRDGALAATVAQEGLMRYGDKTP